MPSRRNPDKTNATRTPLADIAPSLPPRDEEVARDAAAESSIAASETIPDDDMLPESTATMAAEGPETDTAPANVRSRPGARKVSSRSAVPAVPRTIAEMQAQADRGTESEGTATRDEAQPIEEAPPPPLFVSLRVLVVTAIVLYAILAFLPGVVLIITKIIGLSDITRAVINFIALAIGSVIAVTLLFRAWRVAFGTAPSALHPVAVLELWERRASGERDIWVTWSIIAIAGFVLLLLFFLITAIVQAGLASIYFIPYYLLTLFAHGTATAIFIGYLQGGLMSRISRVKAALIAGLVYGIAAAFANGITIAASSSGTTASAQATGTTGTIITFGTIGIVIALITAWFRLRSRSLVAAIAFQLLLFLLRFPL